MWRRYGEARDSLIKGYEVWRGHGGGIEPWRHGRTTRAHTPNGDCVSRVHGVGTFTEYGVFNGGG